MDDSNNIPNSSHERYSMLKSFLYNFSHRYKFKPNDVNEYGIINYRLIIRKALYLCFANDTYHLKQLFPHYPDSALPESLDELLNSSSISNVKLSNNDHDNVEYANKINQDGSDNNCASESYDFQLNKNYTPGHPNTVCSKIFQKYEPYFRCLTCSSDDTCALCYNCFDPQYHAGHNVKKFICVRSNSGKCDCGDADSWKNSEVEEYIPCKYSKVLHVPDREISTLLKTSMFSTIECALDYIIDVLCLSQNNTENSYSLYDRNSSFEISSESKILDPEAYGIDPGTDSISANKNQGYYLVLYNDQSKHLNEAISKIRKVTMKVPEFAEMVAINCHEQGRSIVLASSDLNFLIQRQQILNANLSIDPSFSNNNNNSFSSDNSNRYYSVIKTREEFFREEICLTICQWLNDLLKGPVFGNFTLTTNLISKALACKWIPGVKEVGNLAIYNRTELSDISFPGKFINNKIPVFPMYYHGIEKDLTESAKYWKSFLNKTSNSSSLISGNKSFLSSKLCEACGYNPYFSNTNISPIQGSRFQYLLILDVSLWKKFRFYAQSIYIVAVSNPKYISILSCQYADIYPTLSELMMMEDRDVEWNSTNHLSVQIFTNSQIATIYCSPLRNDLLKLLNVAQGFLLTGHIFPFHIKSQILPEWFNLGNRIQSKDIRTIKKCASLDSLKLRRWNSLFFDLNFLVSRTNESQELFEKRLLDSLYNILEFFQGLPVLKREAVEHVQYESNDYPLYFSAVTSVMTFCKNQITSISRLKSSEKEKEICIFAINGLLEKFLYFMDICLLNRLTDGLNTSLKKDSTLSTESNDLGALPNADYMPNENDIIDGTINNSYNEALNTQNDDVVINVDAENIQDNNGQQQGERNIVIMDVNVDDANDDSTGNSINQNRIQNCTNKFLSIKSDIYPAIKYHSVTIHNWTFKDIIDFKVHEGYVSFLHPLSSYFSYLIEQSKMESPDELLRILHNISMCDSEMCTESSGSNNSINDNLNSMEPTSSINEVLLLISESERLSPPFHQEVRALFDNNLERVQNKNNIFQIIHDYSLRAIVLASQIKVGFWVRNGLSIKSQFYNYRNLGLRELGFVRDLHIVQSYSCTSTVKFKDSGNFFMATLLDRWGLVDWANFEYSKNLLVYDCVETLQFMVEEFVIFLITLLETNDNLVGLNNQDVNSRTIKNQILHFLCFKSCSFAELCKELPDHISNDKMFDVILNKLADFYGPQSITESMEDLSSTQHADMSFTDRYKLKEKYFNDINPYYIHYNSNKRDDAEKLLKDIQLRNMKKNPEIDDDIKKSLTLNDTFISPKKIELSPFFSSLFDFTSSDTFINFLRGCLIICFQNGTFSCQVNVEESGEIYSTVLSNNISYDGILRFTLHLIHICLCNDNSLNGEFAKKCLKSYIENDGSSNTIVLILYKFLLIPSDKDYFVTISPFFGKIRAIFGILRKSVTDFDSYLSEKISEYDMDITLHPWNSSRHDSEQNDSAKSSSLSEFEKKKLKAAERRAKIMAALKKQQNSFMEKNSIDVEDLSCLHVSKSFGEESTNECTVATHNFDCSCSFPSLNIEKCWNFPEESCILCQMPANDENDVFGTLCYVTESSEFRNIPADSNYWTFKAFSDESDTDNVVCHSLKEIEEKSVIGPGFPTEKPFSSVSKHVITGCGHGMHLSCFKHHLKTTRRRLTHFTKTLPEDISNKEFICPLCKGLCNCLIPMLSKSNGNDLARFVKPNSDSTWHYPFENFKKSLGENYYDGIYTALSQRTLGTVQSKYYKLFHSCGIEVDRAFLEETHDMLTGSNQALRYITSSYMDDNISLLLANTIESTEILLRIGNLSCNQYCNEFILDRIPNQVLTNLRILSEFKKNSELFECEISESNKDNIIYKYLSSFKLICSKEFFEFENVDYFETLVECFYMRDRGFSFNSIMIMCLFGEILKNSFLLVSRIISKHDFIKYDSNFYKLSASNYTDDETIKNSKILMDKLLIFNNCTIPKHLVNNISVGAIFFNMLLKCILPFLRKCAIWSYINAPVLEDERMASLESCTNEEEKLTKFLNVPMLSTFIFQMLNPNTFEGRIFLQLSKKIIQESNTFSRTLNKLQIKYPGKTELIKLPKRLDSFFVDYFYQNFNDSVNFDPAVCLCCGKVVKFQQYSIGMRSKGECNLHYEQSCLKNCGLFFLPKHISILVLYKGNGSFYDAPYYDEHGELANSLKELGSKHMQPYYLNERKYQDFMYNIWLQHNSANYVIRNLENSVDVGGWETL